MKCDLCDTKLDLRKGLAVTNEGFCLCDKCFRMALKIQKRRNNGRKTTA